MDDLKNWLILNRIPGFGSRKILQLLTHVEEPAQIVNAPGGQLKQWGFSAKAIDFLGHDPEQALVDDLDWLGDDKHIVTFEQPQYPSLLREITDPPLLLYVQGNVSVLNSPQLAIVGSRNPTAQGKNNAEEFASALSQSGMVVTSGMALGIDAAAHEGALKSHQPTIAIMGTGLDRVYPARHRDLAHRISEQGALVSEFAIGTGVKPGHFPKRNRIISGLSLGVLVVEAAIKSGSLITAKLAMDQGREVFAIPGSIHNPLARGCHLLIRDGAKLVETANDVVEELSAMALFNTKKVEGKQSSENNHKNSASLSKTGTHLAGNLDNEQQAILDVIDFSTTPVDVIVERSRLSVEVVSGTLLI
ncbi:MAG TPA: DNA-protecting protein DprA, partial [Aeromonadales bacterium]|nr:DNA-protecting protein DprA [Aeromonadales bacterium]